MLCCFGVMSGRGRGGIDAVAAGGAGEGDGVGDGGGMVQGLAWKSLISYS